MSDLRMELIHGQLKDIEENVRSIKATWGNTITTLDNIKTSLKADRQKAIDEAYQKGFEAGQHEATMLEYQCGLNEAWECAKRIALVKTDEDCPYFTVSELKKIFGYSTYQSVFNTYSASEAIEKVKAYEEHQKVDDVIEVGDEVTLKSNDSNCLGVVVRVDDTNAILMTRDGYTTMYRLEILKKTDCHFPQVAELIKAMKGVTE